ncbi:helix-turn-helix domain-containing protein [Nocardioides speluncae]|uniref:helix-turn-helix domain-containing protein n=1 Tax=Nocardioides speluncae TaxID=2670337 RepID=UPI0030B8399F
MSVQAVKIWAMARFRLTPTPTQEMLLLEHCSHARFVWNPLSSSRIGVGAAADMRPATTSRRGS